MRKEYARIACAALIIFMLMPPLAAAETYGLAFGMEIKPSAQTRDSVVIADGNKIYIEVRKTGEVHEALYPVKALFPWKGDPLVADNIWAVTKSGAVTLMNLSLLHQNLITAGGLPDFSVFGERSCSISGTPDGKYLFLGTNRGVHMFNFAEWLSFYRQLSQDPSLKDKKAPPPIKSLGMVPLNLVSRITTGDEAWCVESLLYYEGSADDPGIKLFASTSDGRVVFFNLTEEFSGKERRIKDFYLGGLLQTLSNSNRAKVIHMNLGNMQRQLF